MREILSMSCQSIIIPAAAAMAIRCNVMGVGLDSYECKPRLLEQTLSWSAPIEETTDLEILASMEKPFLSEGGMRLVTGALGTGVVKVSAVDKEHHLIEAPCKIFDTQDALKDAFEAGELEQDFVAVVRFQGPAANGMPELHKLTPYLGILQDKGFKVALVTDGRMSGASGKVLSAIHVSPEAKNGGPLALLRDGDVVRLDAHEGSLEVKLEQSEMLNREPVAAPENSMTVGRGLFKKMRSVVQTSTLGASVF